MRKRKMLMSNELCAKHSVTKVLCRNTTCEKFCTREFYILKLANFFW